MPSTRRALLGAAASLVLPLAAPRIAHSKPGLDGFEFRDGIGRRAGGPNLPILADGAGQYPRATAQNWWQPPYGVDAFSRLDEIFAVSTARRAAVASPWRRADREPAIRFAYPASLGGGRYDLDGYLDRQPATGLLIAQGDTILAERYQYGRSDTMRLTSFSMAKTIVALLIGLAAAPLAAQPKLDLPAPDRAAIRTIIESQMAAFRRDDGAGPAVAERVRERLEGSEGVVVHVRDQLTPELAGELDRLQAHGRPLVGRAEDFEDQRVPLLAGRGQVLLAQDPGTPGVVDVVVHVGDEVRHPHDLPFERRRPLLRVEPNGRSLLTFRVATDAIPHLEGEVEPQPVVLEHLDHPHRLLVVAETAAHRLVEERLAGVAERRMPQVVGETTDFDQVRVATE